MEQITLEPRAGEQVAEGAALAVTLVVEREELGVVDVRAEPGAVTPPPHLHRSHGEAFHVLAGELTFQLDDGEHRAGAGTWVFLPPNVVHTFTVSGQEQAHYLDMHMPGSGFGDFMRDVHAALTQDELASVRAGFDQEAAPAEGSADPALAVLSCAGGADGETIVNRPGRRSTLLVDAEEATVSEYHYGPGERGAEPHVHLHHADAFVVVEGEFTFSLRNGSYAAPAGTLVFIPPGVVHGFDNASDADARCFNLHVPASGFADHMRGRNPAFDQHDPPADGGVDPEELVVVRLSQ